MKTDTAPYSLVRPTTDFDFNLIKGKTFSGWNIDPDGTSDPESFTISQEPAQNTITFGNTIGDNITLKIRNAVIATDIVISTGLDSSPLAKHATYVGKSGDNSTIIAIVVSPDGKALSLASCDAPACRDNLAGGSLENWFKIDAAGVGAMTYSVMGSF